MHHLVPVQISHPIPLRRSLGGQDSSLTKHTPRKKLQRLALPRSTPVTRGLLDFFSNLDCAGAHHQAPETGLITADAPAEYNTRFMEKQGRRVSCEAFITWETVTSNELKTCFSLLVSRLVPAQALPSEPSPNSCSPSLMGESANAATVVPSVRIRNPHVEGKKIKLN